MRNKKQKRVVEKLNPKQKDLGKSISALRGELATTKKALREGERSGGSLAEASKGSGAGGQASRARIEKLQYQLAGASATSATVQAGADGGADLGHRWPSQRPSMPSPGPTRRGPSSSCGPKLAPED